MQGQGEEVGLLPATGRQVRQHRDAAGIEVAYPAQQVQAIALGQMFQAIDHQRQVKPACRQVVRQRSRRRMGHAGVRMGELERFKRGEFAGANQQQTRRGVTIKQCGQRLLGRARRNTCNHRISSIRVPRLACPQVQIQSWVQSKASISREYGTKQHWPIAGGD
ncbi:hypothetical protein D3C86_1675750 [compost metagenome]